MTPRERVVAALDHQQPDFTPCDYFATPEIHDALVRHFGVTEDHEIRACLGCDIRYIRPPYTGPPLPEFDDRSTMNIWGIRRRPMPNEYGEYAEPINFPYRDWKTVEEAEEFNWPSPEWYDYSAVPSLCDDFPDLAVAAGGFEVQDFINGIAFGRGVEEALLDIALENPIYLHIVEQRHRFYLEHIARILEAGRGRIDLVLCGDDFGTQQSLLISPAAFEHLFAAKKREFFDMVHSYGAKVTHHCCGSSRALFPQFIACGMDALQTIQTRAAGMDPYGLKADFGDQITLHGAVDVQGWLQESSRQEIVDEVERLMDEVGRDGGYILSPSHNIQPDVPLENVLAVYETVARRRGVRLGRP